MAAAVSPQALAGQCFAHAAEITLATKVTTRQLNQRARPWVWVARPEPRRSLVIGPMSGSLRTTLRPLTIAEAAAHGRSATTPTGRGIGCDDVHAARR